MLVVSVLAVGFVLSGIQWRHLRQRHHLVSAVVRLQMLLHWARQLAQVRGETLIVYPSHSIESLRQSAGVDAGLLQNHQTVEPINHNQSRPIQFHVNHLQPAAGVMTASPKALDEREHIVVLGLQSHQRLRVLTLPVEIQTRWTGSAGFASGIQFNSAGMTPGQQGQIRLCLREGGADCGTLTLIQSGRVRRTLGAR